MSTPIAVGASRGRRLVRRPSGVLTGLLAFVVACLLIVADATGAAAHAQLVSTSPEDGAALKAAPAKVELHFNEPVQLVEGGIRLIAGGEDPRDIEAQAVDSDILAEWPGDAGEGHYTLSYRVVSTDGHPISGAITFTVGEPAGPASTGPAQADGDTATRVALVVLTAMQYVGLLMLAGLRFFDRIVLRSELPGTARAGAVHRGAALLSAAASVLLVPTAALHVMGGRLPEFFSPSGWWPGVLWPPVAVAAIVLIASGAAVATRFGTAAGSAGRATADVAVLAALLAPVLVGHTMAFEPRALMMAADAGHLLAGAFWLGGLTGLLIHLARTGRAGRDALSAAAAVERFSRFALWSVLLLAASGTAMGVVTVGSLGALVSTGYGLALLIKLGVIAPIVAIAAYNRFRLVPALAGAPTGAPRWRTLIRTLACEAGLLVVVLVVTGVLTNLRPGPDEQPAGAAAPAETIELEASAQQLEVDGSLRPALAGANELTFTLRYEGEPVTPEEVTVRARAPEHDLGPFEVEPDLDPDTGSYTATLTLPIDGDWDLQVVARVSTFAEPIVTIPVSVGS